MQQLIFKTEYVGYERFFVIGKAGFIARVTPGEKNEVWCYETKALKNLGDEIIYTDNENGSHRLKKYSGIHDAEKVETYITFYNLKEHLIYVHGEVFEVPTHGSAVVNQDDIDLVNSLLEYMNDK